MFNLISNIFGSKRYIILLILAVVICFIAGQNYFGWLLSIFTTYAIMANNCAQTIGMFIATNKNKSKERAIYFLVPVFIITILISWLFYDRQLDFFLLDRITYSDDLSLLLIFLPILLFLLTKYKIPVSATFLIIPIFANKSTIQSMISKTSVSYFVSFVISLIIWRTIYIKYKHWIEVKNEGGVGKIWFILQFISTGIVWAVWIVLSTCNFVVFLPRIFGLKELLLFMSVGVVSTCLILFDNGGEIQEIVDEKSDINIKSSVVFNFLFAFVMLFIQYVSKIPITSTWMFLGILAGREFAITVSRDGIFGSSYYRKCFVKVWSDLRSAIFGIVVSLAFVEMIGLVSGGLVKSY